MSNPDSEGEPTMEEILASIRKIISEDDVPGQEGAEENAAPRAAQEGAEPSVADPAEDVLELTERVEGGSTEEQEIDAILTSVTGGAAAPQSPTPAAPGTAGGLLSPKTDTAVTSSLANFFGTMVKDKQPQETPSGASPTLDEVVRASLEPYLKTWLDENLEPLVERIVKEELKRMARRAEDL